MLAMLTNVVYHIRIVLVVTFKNIHSPYTKYQL